ncbi:MAG: hypothetical protein IKN00_06885 [Bacteroidales bacterium]|nr:hypothetical protein [Bacteroidales bacterium]
MRLRILFLTCLILASASLAEAGAQGVRDFRFVKDITPALQLSNPAALTTWSGKLSSVALEGTKGNGAVVPIEGSANDFSVTAGTESFFRLSGKLAFHGALSWSNSQGRDMSGPILMNPEQYPVSFLERDQSTAGIKKRELYGLEGAMALNLGSRWALGCGVRYTSGDQTKVKDPRFMVVLMDLIFTLGAAFRASDALLLGVSLHYRDLLEQVRGGIYGTGDIQYFVQTDKGGFLGSVAELAGDYNYVPVTEYRPMANHYYGISFQALIRERFSNELSIRYRTGYYGKKASTSPVFFEYAGIEAGYSGRLLLPAGAGLHRLALDLDFASVANDENVLRYVTPAGQSTVVEYLGSNRVLDRIDMSATLDYRWYSDTAGPRPGLTLGAKLGYAGRMQTTSLYPLWRKHATHTVSLDLTGRKVWTDGTWSWILDAGLSGLLGFGTDKLDGTYGAGDTPGLKSFDDYLGRYYEYKTLPRAGASLGFTAARRFGSGVEAYLRISDSYVHLLSAPQYLGGSSRNLARVTLGCNF